MDIDSSKTVYLFTHGRFDLREKAVAALESNGIAPDNIVDASPNKTGDIGDYMAMLWMPPNPDHIKMQRIVEVKAVEPEGMIGLWKGVDKEDIGTIPL